MNRRYPALDRVFSKEAQFPKKDKPVKRERDYEDPYWLLAHANEIAGDPNHPVYIKTDRTSGEKGADAERTWTKDNGHSIGAGEKFWKHTRDSRTHIIRHEAIHDITDACVDDEEFWNLYREGAFGGTWQTPLEAVTHILTDFVEDPEWVREALPKAYEYFMQYVPYLRGVAEGL